MYQEHKHGLHAICKTRKSGHYETRSYPHMPPALPIECKHRSTQLSQVKQLYTAKDTEMRYWKVGTCQIKGTKQAAWQISSIHLLISRATFLPRPWFDSNFIISSFFSFSRTLNELLLQTWSLEIFRTSSEVGSRNCCWLSVFRQESPSANRRVTEVREAYVGTESRPACCSIWCDCTVCKNEVRQD